MFEELFLIHQKGFSSVNNIQNYGTVWSIEVMKFKMPVKTFLFYNDKQG